MLLYHKLVSRVCGKVWYSIIDRFSSHKIGNCEIHRQLNSCFFLIFSDCFPRAMFPCVLFIYKFIVIIIINSFCMCVVFYGYSARLFYSLLQIASYNRKLWEIEKELIAKKKKLMSLMVARATQLSGIELTYFLLVYPPVGQGAVSSIAAWLISGHYDVNWYPLNYPLHSILYIWLVICMNRAPKKDNWYFFIIYFTFMYYNLTLKSV